MEVGAVGPVSLEGGDIAGNLSRTILFGYTAGYRDTWSPLQVSDFLPSDNSWLWHLHSLVWIDLVLGQELSYDVAGRFPVGHVVQDDGIAHRISLEEPFVKHLAGSKGAATDVPGQAE